jgi:hypothetical protein
MSWNRELGTDRRDDSEAEIKLRSVELCSHMVMDIYFTRYVGDSPSSKSSWGAREKNAVFPATPRASSRPV